MEKIKITLQRMVAILNKIDEVDNILYQYSEVSILNQDDQLEIIAETGKRNALAFEYDTLLHSLTPLNKPVIKSMHFTDNSDYSKTQRAKEVK